MMRLLLATALMLLAVIVTAGPAEAQQNPPSVTFQWSPPTEFVNGDPLDPLTDISTYEIRCWETDAPGEYTTIQVPGQTEEGVHTALLAELFTEHGYYECELAAIGQYGAYSDWVLAQSAEPLPFLPPKPGSPTNTLMLF